MDNNNIDIRVTEAGGVEKVIRFGNIVMIGTEHVPVVGPQGPAGIDGKDGKDGKDGLNGTNGTNGIDGTNGTNGIDGTNGTNGIDGKDGVDGKNAFQVAVDNGFVGDESAWLTSLIGQKGEKGDQGEKGSTGSAGPNVNFGTLSSLALTETPQATYLNYSSPNYSETISGLNLLQPGVIYYLRINSTHSSGLKLNFPTGTRINNTAVNIAKNYSRTFSLLYDGIITEVHYGGEVLV